MPTKPKRAALSPAETICVLAQVYDHYGLDRSRERDRSQDGDRAEEALYRAARDGLLRPPPRKRGAPLKWQGEFNLELVEAVESVQREERPRLRGPAMRITPISVADAIEILRKQDKWKRFSAESLKKRYFEAKREWTYFRRLTRFGARIPKLISS
jgi:hypothetical protein